MKDKEFQEEFGMTIAEFDDYVENGDWFIEGEK